MLYGIIITRFDLKIGPLAEYVFPKNFISEGELFDLSFRIWTGAGFLNLSEAKGTFYQAYSNYKFFGVSRFDNHTELGAYAITCLFSEEDSSVIVANLKEIEEILNKANERLQNGEDPEKVLEETFTLVSDAVNKMKEKEEKKKELSKEITMDKRKIKENLEVALANIKVLKNHLQNINDENVKSDLLATIEVITSALMSIATIMLTPDEISELLSKII
ncbi:MAG: hypothetical protein ACP6IS_03310 [Candidatus Asgardarchaeia archaeon]